MTEPPSPIQILGAGGHAKVAIAAARLAGRRVDTVCDDNPQKWGTHFMGIEVQGPIESAAEIHAAPTLIAIGDNSHRNHLATRLRCEWASITHPAAFVDAGVYVGAGTLVLAHAVVQVDATLGAHVIVNDGAVVEHDCRVHDGAHLGPRSCLTGGVEVGRLAFIGAGAVVLPGLKIGAAAVVGAGAVVTRDVPAHETVVGSPARTARSHSFTPSVQ